MTPKQRVGKKITYYRITAKDCDEWWIVDKPTLRRNIVEWTEEYGRVTVRPIQMTLNQFLNLPEL